MARRVPFFVKPEHQDALATRGLTSLEACRTFVPDAVVKALVPGRETLRFSAGGAGYFLKRITGPAAHEIPHEAAIVGQLAQCGEPVAEVVAVGADDAFAAMITRALPVVSTLEARLCGGEPASPQVTAQFGRQLAERLRRLHAAGVQHRDCYLGHVLVAADDRLYWTDFGRARSMRRLGWLARIKDLAGLDFSTPARVASDRARLAFLRRYLGPVSRWKWRAFARLVRAKARRMRGHVERQIASGKPNLHVNR